MVQQNKFIITESEKRRIQELYGIKKQKDFVFDFVLTENYKYLIIMDQVFINGGSGKSIGSIWEHTYIFNELINESLSTINESIKKEINVVIDNFVWTKEFVSECISTTDILVEGLWDDIKSGTSNLISKVGEVNAKILGTAFKQGVIPFLRWVRRMAYTSIGIVIDVIVAILSVKSSAIVWALIVLLDIYEIITDDFDPQDPSRGQMPYMMLAGDVLALLFSGAVGLMWKGAAKSITSKGLAKTSPKLVPYIQQLSTKIPSLKSSLKSAGDALTKKMGAGGIVSKILSGLDSVLAGLITFTKKLLSKQGAVATAAGVGVLGVTKGIEYGMEKTSSGDSIAKYAKKGEDFAQSKFGKTNFEFDKSSDSEIEDKLASMGYIK